MHLANAWELHVAHACNMLGFELGKCLSLVVVCACVCFQIGQFQGNSKQNTRGCRRRLEAYMSASLINSSAVHFYCNFPVCQSSPRKFHYTLFKNQRSTVGCLDSSWATSWGYETWNACAWKMLGTCDVFLLHGWSLSPGTVWARCLTNA